VNAVGRTAASALVQGLVELGVELVFGVSGGGIAGVWSAVGQHAGLQLVHMQHESGAAFAAAEASIASGRPTAVLVTTGPGLTNALTGLVAARQEGASVIVLSGITPASRRGQGATQETDASGPVADLLRAGPVFHVAQVLESAEQVETALRRLAIALARPGGCVAHLGVPTDVGLAMAPHGRRVAAVRQAPRAFDPGLLDGLAAALLTGRVVVLAGRGARGAALGELADRCGVGVLTTPDAKGAIAEDHGGCLGVLGIGGQADAHAALAARFDLLLVLGARLGEAECGWVDALRPRERAVFVGEGDDLHVGSYADMPLMVAEGSPAALVEALLGRLGPLRPPPPRARPPALVLRPGPVRPAALMQAVQAVAVDDSDAVVLAESGASFVWAIHMLRMPAPRLRVSVGWGAMGHATTGAIGVAATGRRAVAIVGDGAMLMGNELATAVRRGLRVTWVVLNDGGYGMCRHGMRALGLRGSELDQPPVDFAAMARAAGLVGLTVREERDLEGTLRAALEVDGPALLDVYIDPDEAPPMGRRIQALTFHAAVVP
jgi:acetolactate synthase-1/2/3 large subunit